MVILSVIQSDIDLQSFNTLRLPAIARQFIQADSRDQLLASLQQHADVSQPLLLLGGGSNLILTGDYEGICLWINSRGIEAEPLADHRVRVCVQAGEPWHQFVDYCLLQGWYGLENLALIPGTVGASPIQNIGAYGVEVKQYIDQVEAWDRTLKKRVFLSNDQCQFGYRDSIFKSGQRDRYVIVSVVFNLPTQFTPVLSYGGLAALLSAVPSARQVFDAVVDVRQQKLPDPDKLANAGSFFKNPVLPQAQFDAIKSKHPGVVAYPDTQGVKLAAGWLIDQAGWKGVREGAVGVHVDQALVLVNYGGANGAQLLSLAHRIQADIEQRFGVLLEIEPRII